jgi:hypothetical protein
MMALDVKQLDGGISFQWVKKLLRIDENHISIFPLSTCKSLRRLETRESCSYQRLVMLGKTA